MKRLLLAGATAILVACGGTSKHAQQFTQLHKGMTKAEVRAAVGKPGKIVQIPFPSPGSLDEGFEDCWDYGLETLPRTNLHELCFWNGRLSSNTTY